MQLRTHIIYRVLILAAVVIASLLAFQYGRHLQSNEIDELQEEIQKYRQMEHEATIVKSVSTQMEDIAYQQKAISDEQRILAEENARKAEINAREADANARIAEEESKLARAAETEANQQKSIAEEKRLEAEKANTLAQKSLQETRIMTYRRVASQLGTTAYTQFSNDNAHERVTSALLGYWSYAFLKRNGGNTYFADTYKVLSNSSGVEKTFSLASHSCINAVASVPGRKHCIVGVSNYGEITIVDGNQNNVLLGHDDRDLDFRAVVATRDNILALDCDGQLLSMDYNGKERGLYILNNQSRQKTKTTDNELFCAMLQMDQQRLLIASDKALRIMDISTKQVTKTMDVKGGVSCMYRMKDVMCIHLNNGGYMQVDSQGNISQLPKVQKQSVVTAGCYDPKTGLRLLGRKDGTTEIINKYGRKMTEIPGQGSKIAAVTVIDTIGVLCSYDHSVLICNMPKFKMESGYSFREELEMRTIPAAPGNGPSEWITPVRIRFDGWPLSVAADHENKNIYVGTSAGSISVYSTDVDKLAQMVVARLKTDLTRGEWSRFIGDEKIFPYETIKESWSKIQGQKR